MITTLEYINKIFVDAPAKTVISKPASKSSPCKKIVIENKGDYYQASKYTEKQVFHENLSVQQAIDLCSAMLEKDFKQLNSFSKSHEYMVMISKKGKASFKTKQISKDLTVSFQKEYKNKVLPVKSR